MLGISDFRTMATLKFLVRLELGSVAPETLNFQGFLCNETEFPTARRDKRGWRRELFTRSPRSKSTELTLLNPRFSR